MLSRGSLVLVAIILARSFDATTFATYSYFQLTVSMLGAYAAMGMGVTATRFFAEVRSGPTNCNKAPIGTLWLLSLIFAVIAFLLIYLLPDSLFDAGVGVPRSLMALGVLILVLNVVPGGAALGLEQYRNSAYISLVSGVVVVAGAKVAASSGASKHAILALICFYIIQGLGHSFLVVRYVGLKPLLSTVRLNLPQIARVFNVALPMLMVTLMSASGTWLLGRIILAGEGGEQAFAYYAIGLQWFALALLIPGMLARVALPMMIRARVVAVNERYHSRRLVRITALLAVASGVFMAVCAAALGPWLMSLYGNNYPESRWFIAAFMLSGVLLAPVNTVGNAIIANNFQWQWLAITFIWFLALNSFGYIFQNYGNWTGPTTLTGAAIAMSISALYFAKSQKLI